MPMTGTPAARTAFAARELQLQAAPRHRQRHANHRAVALLAAAAAAPGFAGAAVAVTAATFAVPMRCAKTVVLGWVDSGHCVHPGACIQVARHNQILGNRCDKQLNLAHESAS